MAHYTFCVLCLDKGDTLTCSHCGYENTELTLRTRVWTCSDCGETHDRDVNAAINLRKYAVSYTVSACGELVETITSKKQELNITIA